MIKFLTFLSVSFLLLGCQNNTNPKPKAMLRLEYPQASYELFSAENCPFEFQKNTQSQVKYLPNCGLNIQYPKMKATIYLTYKPVDKNLKNLLSDAQKFTYEHIVKANNIIEQPFENQQDKVYGMFYEVEGNAASQSQFYATDSTRNFLTGSIYFRVKPNYDSVQPAAFYLKKDIRAILETLRWK